jgi:predicted dehydrogenase
MSGANRRDFLQAAGLAGLLSGVSSAAMAQGISGAGTVDEANSTQAEIASTHHARFSVIGLDHAHIFGMTRAMIRGGGELVSVHAQDPAQVAAFRKEFPDVKLAAGEDEILDDKSIQLVLSAAVPDLRAPLGIRVMKAGEDYLSDKPAITSFAQLAQVRKAIRETGRKFAIMYSERLEVRSAIYAGELVQQGAIGKVVQTINIAPHQMKIPTRPEWFFDKSRFGGILCDVGSHQVEQFLFYTGSRRAHVVAAQTGNVGFPQYPKFEDFGDMIVTGNGGTGYVRVDWFTPDGLGTWGDGRLFILGTDGYIELRKYTNVAVAKGGNHLFIVDRKQARYINCDKVPLPFGPQFVRDVVERSAVAQDQEQALLAAELVLQAQKIATRPVVA